MLSSLQLHQASDRSSSYQSILLQTDNIIMLEYIPSTLIDWRETTAARTWCFWWSCHFSTRVELRHEGDICVVFCRVVFWGLRWHHVVKHSSRCCVMILLFCNYIRGLFVFNEWPRAAHHFMAGRSRRIVIESSNVLTWLAIKNFGIRVWSWMSQACTIKVW